jgi:hypothetical protein
MGTAKSSAASRLLAGTLSAESLSAPRLKPGRSAATNDPCFLPKVLSQRAQDRRRRDLIAIYIGGLGGFGAVSELKLVEVRRAAELVAASEMMRARLLRGENVDPSILLRLEGVARRAERALKVEKSKASEFSLMRHRMREAAKAKAVAGAET